MTTLQTFNENMRTIEVRIAPHGPTSPRWSTAVNCFLDLGDNTYAFTGHTVDLGHAKPEGYVAAEMKVGFHLFEPAAGDPNRTHIVAINHIDPKGSVPAMIINAVLKRRGKLYELLQDRINAL
jgi:hypothetical protein